MLDGWLEGHRDTDTDKCPVISDILQQKEEYNGDLNACSAEESVQKPCTFQTLVYIMFMTHVQDTAIFIHLTTKWKSGRERRIPCSLTEVTYICPIC